MVLSSLVIEAMQANPYRHTSHGLAPSANTMPVWTLDGHDLQKLPSHPIFVHIQANDPSNVIGPRKLQTWHPSWPPPRYLQTWPGPFARGEGDG
jgi:hypothetical protein